MKAKLKIPFGEKNWCLEFSNISEDERVHSDILYLSHYLGIHFGARTFEVCNCKNYILIGFRCSSDDLVIKVSEKICEKLKVSLEI